MRHRFLLPRLLLDFARLLAELGGEQRRPTPAVAQASRDPVCGMTVAHDSFKLAHDGQIVQFCSEECRRRFRKNPKRFLAGGATP